MKKKIDCLKLLNFIENSSDFKTRILPCRKILIAYSGGQDSSALLALFYILSKKWRFSIGVIYCNHNWSNSTKETITIFNKIQNLSLPFYFVDAEQAMKPETVARDWRYNAFNYVLENYDYDLLLTGHTLSDCAETIIFNLCRGSGLQGVCSLKKFQVFELQKKKDFLFKSIPNFDLSDFFVEKYDTMFTFEKFKYAELNQPSFFLDKSFGYFLYHWYLINKVQASKLKLYKTSYFCGKTVCSDLRRLNSTFKSFIMFFDPLTYFLLKKRLQKKTYFSSIFIYSLFSNSFFYLKKEFSLVPQYYVPFFKSHTRPLFFYISYRIKSGIAFEKLLNRKLQERILIPNSNPHSFELNLSIRIPNTSTFLFINYFLFKIYFVPSVKWRIGYLGYRSIKKQKPKLLVYRPFIPMTRQMIFHFGQELKLSIVHDSSNNDLKLTRNFIRKIVLPTLKHINPKVEQNLYRFSQITLFYLEHSDLRKKTITSIEIFIP